jgi:hypothetical protein
VDRWKELLVVDPSVVQGPRARNDVDDAPFSFRTQLERLAGEKDRAPDLAHQWLLHWKTATEVAVSPGSQSAARVQVDPRPSVGPVLLCPWLRLSPDNRCNADCSSCLARRLDLTRAPFRLIAIANRADLGEAAGACGRDGGELRFVYTAVAPETGRPLELTVILEYGITLPPGSSRRSWARDWRALGALPFGPAYDGALADVVRRGLQAATLLRVQTNELAFSGAQGGPWELRQFVPAAGTRAAPLLEGTAVDGTPRHVLDGSDTLARWVQGNRAAILAGDNPLPADMRAGAAVLPHPEFAWRAPGASADALAAFNRNTCSGCHGGRATPDDLPFQHVAPGSMNASYQGGAPVGAARVSRFLHAPGQDDELGRRARHLQATACGRCEE